MVEKIDSLVKLFYSNYVIVFPLSKIDRDNATYKRLYMINKDGFQIKNLCLHNKEINE